jgi:hypothetical protein
MSQHQVGPFSASLEKQLSSDDRAHLERLQSFVRSPASKYNRNRKLSAFNEILTMICSFCDRHPDDRWKRCLVCGVCPLECGALAVNTHQLTSFLKRSKSSINGVLADLGYVAVQVSDRDLGFLRAVLQKLDCCHEIRKWTIRRLRNAGRLAPELPILAEGLPGELDRDVHEEKMPRQSWQPCQVFEADITDVWLFDD